MGAYPGIGWGREGTHEKGMLMVVAKGMLNIGEREWTRSESGKMLMWKGG